MGKINPGEKLSNMDMIARLDRVKNHLFDDPQTHSKATWDTLTERMYNYLEEVILQLEKNEIEEMQVMD